MAATALRDRPEGGVKGCWTGEGTPGVDIERVRGQRSVCLHGCV